MLFLRKDIAEELCILVFSTEVLDLDGCVVSDRNAATDMVRFYSPLDGIEKLSLIKYLVNIGRILTISLSSKIIKL